MSLLESSSCVVVSLHQIIAALGATGRWQHRQLPISLVQSHGAQGTCSSWDPHLATRCIRATLGLGI